MTAALRLGTGFGHVALAVDDLDATLATAEGAGIEPEREPYRVSEGGSRICFVTDPIRIGSNSSIAPASSA